jgi:hypothetical protein
MSLARAQVTEIIDEPPPWAIQIAAKEAKDPDKEGL